MGVAEFVARLRATGTCSRGRVRDLVQAVQHDVHGEPRVRTQGWGARGGVEPGRDAARDGKRGLHFTTASSFD